MQLDKSKTNILFIHHSTGGLLLRNGDVRNLLYTNFDNIDLWDHAYNFDKRLPNFLKQLTFRTGLSDRDGNMTDTDYDIFISNNSPKEYADIFSREESDTTLSQILQFDVIIIKNCFPTTIIETEDKLNEHKKYYSAVRDGMKRFPDKKFIIFTPPPVRKEVTKKIYAARARELANWMTSDEFAENNNNVYVFNFFDLLADRDGENKNTLKRDYTTLFFRDSHPNKKANRIIGPIFTEFLIEHTKRNSNT